MHVLKAFLYNFHMKWFNGQLDPLFISTLRVIFQIPDTTYVERYLKTWEKLFILSQKSSHPLIRECISVDVIKFNKEIQALWFEGTIFDNPDIPLCYKDRQHLVSIKYNIKFD